MADTSPGLGSGSHNARLLREPRVATLGEPLNMKKHFAQFAFALVALLFLLPTLNHLIKGEPVTFSPSLATGIGFFLAIFVSLLVQRNRAGGAK